MMVNWRSPSTTPRRTGGTGRIGPLGSIRCLNAVVSSSGSSVTLCTFQALGCIKDDASVVVGLVLNAPGRGLPGIFALGGIQRRGRSFPHAVGGEGEDAGRVRVVREQTPEHRGTPAGRFPLRIDEAQLDSDGWQLAEYEGFGARALLEIDSRRLDDTDGSGMLCCIKFPVEVRALSFSIDQIIRGAERTQGEGAVGLSRGRMPVAPLQRIGLDRLAGNRRSAESTSRPESRIPRASTIRPRSVGAQTLRLPAGLSVPQKC